MNLFKFSLIIFIILLGILWAIPTEHSLFVSEKNFKNKKNLSEINKKQSDSYFQKNILCLGVPGKGHPGEKLTDTIILAVVNLPKNITLISIPRDLLVEISYSNQKKMTKINQLYQIGGIKLIKNKVQEITGLETDNYITVDLIAVKEIIDSLDGLNIYVPYDINDYYFPGPNYSYTTFSIKKGWRYLNGELALKYIRTRHIGEGDFDRMKRQQQVIYAIKQKIAGLNPIFDLPKYIKIFYSLKTHINTDLKLSEIIYLVKETRKINSDQIRHIVIDKRSGFLTSEKITLNGYPASVLLPKQGTNNYKEIKDFILQKINQN